MYRKSFGLDAIEQEALDDEIGRIRIQSLLGKRSQEPGLTLSDCGPDLASGVAPMLTSLFAPRVGHANEFCAQRLAAYSHMRQAVRESRHLLDYSKSE